MTVTDVRPHVPAQRTYTPTTDEHAPSLEADIAWNRAQAVAWPEHAAWFAAEAERLVALTDTTALAA